MRPRSGPGAENPLFVHPPETFNAAVHILRRAEKWSPPYFASFGWSYGTTFYPESQAKLEYMLRECGWEPAKPIGAGKWFRHTRDAERGTVPFVVAVRITFAAYAGRTELPGVEELPGRPMTSAQRRAVDPRPAKLSRPSKPERPATSDRHAAAERQGAQEPPSLREPPQERQEPQATQAPAAEPDELNMRARADRRARWEERMAAKPKPKGRKIPQAKG